MLLVDYCPKRYPSRAARGAGPFKAPSMPINTCPGTFSPPCQSPATSESSPHLTLPSCQPHVQPNNPSHPPFNTLTTTIHHCHHHIHNHHLFRKKKSNYTHPQTQTQTTPVPAPTCDPSTPTKGMDPSPSRLSSAAIFRIPPQL